MIYIYIYESTQYTVHILLLYINYNLKNCLVIILFYLMLFPILGTSIGTAQHRVCRMRMGEA